MKKLNGNSTNHQEELFARLKQDFPEVFTEDGIVDPEKLKATLGEGVELAREKYGLSWAGKSDCFKEIQKTTTATLQPDKGESVNFDETENIFIEGDNLEVLRVLQKSYYNKIKMIYIDPPYNTGNDFVYNDKFKQDKEAYLEETGEKNGNGELTKDSALRKNAKDSGHYHSNWLNMMYPRLFLARNLLRRDGVVFVSIDDHELNNLRSMMNEIFGEENFVGCITVKSNPRGRDYGGIAQMHDYLVVYQKTEEAEFENLEEEGKEFPYTDKRGGFEIRELRNRNIAFHIGNRPNLHYPFYVNPKARDSEGFYEISLDKKENWIEVYPKESQSYKTVWRWGKDKSKENLNTEIVGKAMEDGGYQIVEKYRKTARMARSIWDDKDANTEKGTLHVKKLFDGKKVFPFPKPVEMIMRLVEMGSSNEDVVLDFFAGSGTTAEAVVKQNIKDNSNRKFILIQLDESTDLDSEAHKAGFKTISEVGRERIRRSIKAIREGKKQLQLGEISNRDLDMGFKAFKLIDSNFPEWNTNINTAEELEQQLEAFVEQGVSADDLSLIYELLLKSGYDLNSQIEGREVKGEKVYLVEGELVICLSTKVNRNLVDEIIALEPSKVILLERVFENDDQLKTNTLLQMEQADIDFRVI